MADPDLQIRGGGGGHLDPEVRGSPGLKKIIFRPFGPQFGLKVRGAGPLAPPLDQPLYPTIPNSFSYLHEKLSGTIALQPRLRQARKVRFQLTIS